MWKKFNICLNVLMGICGGLWMAAGIYTYWDYKTHLELYAQMSAPWYTPILLSGIASGAVILAALMVKVMIRKKVKKGENGMKFLFHFAILSLIYSAYYLAMRMTADVLTDMDAAVCGFFVVFDMGVIALVSAWFLLKE